jgi:large-conductance mechanosensitive channel
MITVGTIILAIVILILIVTHCQKMKNEAERQTNALEHIERMMESQQTLLDVIAGEVEKMS